MASSYADALIAKVAESYFSKIGRDWHEHRFGTGTDSFLGEPTIGVPTAWAYSGNDLNTPHHSSADTPDRVDARSLRDLSIVSAALSLLPGQRWRARSAVARHAQPDARLPEDSGCGVTVPGAHRPDDRHGGARPVAGRPCRANDLHPRDPETRDRVWCDGHIPLEGVIRLTRAELGPVDFDFVGYFRFLRDHGYVEFVKGQ